MEGESKNAQKIRKPLMDAPNTANLSRFDLDQADLSPRFGRQDSALSVRIEGL